MVCLRRRCQTSWPCKRVCQDGFAECPRGPIHFYTALQVLCFSMCTRLVVSGRRLVQCEYFVGYAPVVALASRTCLPRRRILIKFMGARSCGVSLAGLFAAGDLLHVALCCAAHFSGATA